MGGDGTRTFHLHGILRQLVMEAAGNSWRTLNSDNMANSAVADVSEWVDDSADLSSPGATAASAGFWGTVRSVMGGETTARDGGDGALTFNLHGMLRRLVAEDGFGELSSGIARTAQQMLQHGSVAGGAALPLVAVEALPKVKFTGADIDQSCAICLEAYKEGELLTALRCDHFFHTNCLAGWLRRSPQCPLCRAVQELPSAEPRPEEVAAASSLE